MKNERLWATITLIIIFALCGLVIVSCNDSRPQSVSYVQPPSSQAPVVVAQQPPQDHFWENVFLYHMLFGGNQATVVHQYSRPAYVAPSRSTTIVNNTTIINRPAPTPSYSAPAPRPAPTYTPPRATSYSGSYSSRPSYSSYSYSSRSSYSSFSSGRR